MTWQASVVLVQHSVCHTSLRQAPTPQLKLSHHGRASGSQMARRAKCPTNPPRRCIVYEAALPASVHVEICHLRCTLSLAAGQQPHSPESLSASSNTNKSAPVQADFAPMAYNPAAPPAPEPIAHREKTPPPPDAADGTGLAAAAAADCTVSSPCCQICPMRRAAWKMPPEWPPIWPRC